MNDPLWFPAFFVVGMFVSALVPKALGLCIVFAIGLSALYPDAQSASMLTVLLIPGAVLAAFRD